MNKTPRFSKSTLEFIQKASRQKKPEWLDRHREEYETHLLLPLRYLAQTLKKNLSTHAVGYHFPQKGIGRIKRSANRAAEYGSHFKDWISYTATRPSASRFDHNPSLFFMINTADEEGDEVLFAGGLYMPSSRQLRSIREAIAEDAGALDQLFTSKAFSSRFKGGFSQERKSSRPPRGFDPQHPRLDWLKLQGFYVWRSYSKKEFASAEFAELVSQDALQLLKLNDLLEQAIQGRLKKATPSKGKGPGLLTVLEELDAPKRQMDF